VNRELIDQSTDQPNFVSPKGSQTMLIYENLARERMREAEQDAAEQRLVRRLNSAKRWERLATWTARRAKRAEDLL
jgi:hypothetical protein